MLISSIVIYSVISLAVGGVTAILMYRYARWSNGWALGSGAAIAIALGFQQWWSGLAHVYAASISLFSAVLVGCFFAVASIRQGRRLRAVFISGVLAFASAAVLTFPLETHAVKLDMPNPR